MNGEPHHATVDDVKSGKFDRQGYVIYAVYDDRGHCSYVGMSKSPSKRFFTHQSNSHVPEMGMMINSGKISRIDIYTADMFHSFLSEHTGYRPKPGTDADPDDQSWAREAEKIVCQTLRPYLNKKNVIGDTRFFVLYLDPATLEREMYKWGICERVFFEKFGHAANSGTNGLAFADYAASISYDEKRALIAREENAKVVPWSNIVLEQSC